MKSLFFGLILAASLVLLAHPRAVVAQIGGNEYKDAAIGFRLKPFPRWTRLRETGLAEADARNAKDNPGRNWRVSAAWTKGDLGYLIYPYVLLEVSERNLIGVTFADVERAFGAETRKDSEALLASNAGELFKKLIPGDPLLDRARKRVIQKTKFEIDRVGPGSELVITYLTSRGLVSVVMACDDKLIDEYAPEFQGFLDSFKIEPLAEYAEPSRSTDDGKWGAARQGKSVAKSKAGGKAMGQQQYLVLGGVGLGGLLVIVVIIATVARR